MNQSKIAKNVLLVLTSMMVASLAAYYVLTTLGFSVKRLSGLPLPPVNSVVVTGTIEAIETVASSTVFTILTEAGTSTVQVNLSLENGEPCPADENIADITAFAVGDVLAARGTRTGDVLIPCANGSDYLKVIKDLSLTETIATSSGNIYSNGVARRATATTSASVVMTATTFTGVLEKVDTGCFADGECYVVVDGKHVTVLRGWTNETVGTVEGVEGFGDLERHLGKNIEIRAAVLPDGTYTLYGDALFYIKLLP